MEAEPVPAVIAEEPASKPRPENDRDAKAARRARLDPVEFAKVYFAKFRRRPEVETTEDYARMIELLTQESV